MNIRRNTAPDTGALDRLLQEASGRDWPGPDTNPRIEELLMNEIAKKRAPCRLRLLLGLGALMATGAVFGAARLYEEYTVRIECNGTTFERTVQAGPDGTASFQVPLDGGGAATILVGPGNVGDDGQIQVSIECVSDENRECTVEAQAPVMDGTAALDCIGCPLNDSDKPCENKPE